jgi:hypothetical protein
MKGSSNLKDVVGIAIVLQNLPASPLFGDNLGLALTTVQSPPVQTQKDAASDIKQVFPGLLTQQDCEEANIVAKLRVAERSSVTHF